VILPGQVIVGAAQSFTVTVKPHWEAFPAESVAVQATEVVPFGNSVPELGLQTRVAPVLAVGAKVTTVEHFPASAHRTMFSGQVS
jgi:hypothetical protein